MNNSSLPSRPILQLLSPFSPRGQTDARIDGFREDPFSGHRWGWLSRVDVPFLRGRPGVRQNARFGGLGEDSVSGHRWGWLSRIDVPYRSAHWSFF